MFFFQNPFWTVQSLQPLEWTAIVNYAWWVLILLSPNTITSPKFPWTLYPPPTPVYSLFQTKTSVQLKLIKRETIHCGRKIESFITVHDQKFGFKLNIQGENNFFCFKWLLNCGLDSCQQKGAICSFSPREYNLSILVYQ